MSATFWRNAAIAALFVFSPTFAHSQQVAQPQPRPLPPLWELVCDQNELCLVRASLLPEQGAVPIARVVIGATDSEGEKLWYMNAFFPLGLSIPEGVGFRVDEGRIVKLNLQSCDFSHCRASGRLDVNALGRLKKGEQVRLRYVDAESAQTREVNVPLKGFIDTFNDFVLRVLER